MLFNDRKQKQERIKLYSLLVKTIPCIRIEMICNSSDYSKLYWGDTMNKTLFYFIIIWQEENRSPRISLCTDAPPLKKEKKIGDGGVCTRATKNKSLVIVQSNMIVLPAIDD